MSRRGRFPLDFSAFTLVEMLVVIAIIGILAGILLPVINMARKKARETQAKSDIAGLQQALTQYELEFGALPPDSNDAYTALNVGFDNMNTPNECLVWFLTRTWSRASSSPGCPWGSWGQEPKDAPTVFSRVAGGPYFSPKAKQTRDYDEDKFYEFVDPWGRPYMYRAYPKYITVSGSTYDSGKLFLTLDGEAGLKGIQGQVDLFQGGKRVASGACSGIDESRIEIVMSDPGAIEKVQFPLHNSEGGDLYSLGVNGRTRSASEPRNASDDPAEWSPASGAAEIAKWSEFWGTAGDGNDIEGANSNVLTEPKHRDDLCNWQ